MAIIGRAYPRAAVIGNPSDGYFGKTIAFVFSNFAAEVVLEPSESMLLVPGEKDFQKAKNVSEILKGFQEFGYYGGIRLLKATIKKFSEYNQGVLEDQSNFTLSYNSNIPAKAGLAGSSAIITATTRALLQFCDLQLSPSELANFVLSIERDELGIYGGLQDRVAQAYETPVYMDFDEAHLLEHKKGRYQKIQIPDIQWFIAFRTKQLEGSELLHNNLSQRFNSGEKDVVDAMRQFATLTDQALGLAVNKQTSFEAWSNIINANFDLRASICTIGKADLKMINIARSLGAAAKFTGSGGAIIGCCQSLDHHQQLITAFANDEIEVIIPNIHYS